MDRQRLLKFIQESKQHLNEASNEQKIKILKLIKQAHGQFLESQKQSTEQMIFEEVNLTENSDYLEEK
jgi:hypothetical protein